MKINIAAMTEAAGQASLLLKSLAHPHRLMIVCQMMEAERSVGELAKALEVRDSTVSQHLALLRKDGIVTARRDGQTIWYAISSGPARGVVETVYAAFCPQKPTRRVPVRVKSGSRRAS